VWWCWNRTLEIRTAPFFDVHFFAGCGHSYEAALLNVTVCRSVHMCMSHLGPLCVNIISKVSIWFAAV